MSQSNDLSSNVFRTSLKDWQAAFRARKAQRAAVLGEDAPAAPVVQPREKKMANRKRRAAKA
ncbi:MAG: hypothetical protein EBV06_12175 [Planctomycetia bacterium]|nr:hypothetical protein [Planctomycetia bacterium]